MPRTSRGKSNSLKMTRNLVEATASCQLLTQISSSSLHWQEITTTQLLQMLDGPSRRWNIEILGKHFCFSETTRNDLVQTKEYSNTTSIERHSPAFLLSWSKSLVFKASPQVQTAPFHPLSFLPANIRFSLPPLLLPLGLSKNGYHIFNKSMFCEQSLLLHSFHE